MATVLALAALAGGVALVVVGAEVFAEHLEAASRRLGVSAFALALLLAGAEPGHYGVKDADDVLPPFEQLGAGG
jgi:hypothetical protein